MVLSIREHEGALQVEEQGWLHPDGREVILSGAMHVADPAFYEKISKSMDEAHAQGYTIHLEGLGTLPTDRKLTPYERRVVSILKDMKRNGHALACMTGLTQQSVLKHQYKAHGTKDATFDQMVAQMNPDKVRKHRKSVIYPVARVLPTALRRLAGEGIILLMHKLPSLDEKFFEKGSDTASSLLPHEFILHARNKIAIDHVLNSGDRRAYLFWGAAHLPGMGKLLSEAGYVKAFSNWNTVIRADYQVPRNPVVTKPDISSLGGA